MRIVQEGQSGLIDVGVRLKGALVWRHPNLSAWNWTGLPASGHNVVETLMNGVYKRIPGVYASLFWSGSQSAETRSHEWKGDKPVSIPYTAERDFRNYGSTIANAFVGEIPVSTIQKQKGVKHLSASGLVLPKSTPLYSQYRAGGDFPQWGWDLHTPMSGGVALRYVGSDFHAGVPLTYTTQPMDYWLGSEFDTFRKDMIRLGDYQDFLFNFVGQRNDYYPGFTSEDYPIAGHYEPTTGWFFGDRVFSFTDDGCDIGNVTFIPGWVLRYTRTRHKWRWSTIEPPLEQNTLGHNMYALRVQTEATSYLCFNTAGQGPDGILNWEVVDSIPFSDTYETVRECIPLTDLYRTVVPVEITSRQLVKYARDSHQRFVDNAKLVRPSCMVSYTDAISAMSATQANYVEVIKEGKEIFTLIPSMVGIVKAFLNRKPTSVIDAGRRIGDLLSDAHLLNSFGLKPTLSNVSDIHHMTRTVGPALSSLQSDLTVHGKMVFSFTDLEPFYSGTLVTRSMLRMKGLDDDFVIKLLSLDALGLSPSTSNLWDLVPWSWFIDYFTNLGNRFSTIDAVILGLIRGLHYSVHSFTVYDSPQDVLLDLHLQSEDLEIKHYFREVSRIVPTFFGGPIDYLQPAGPNGGITAAILYKLLAGR